jgi:hypothetical protein
VQKLPKKKIAEKLLSNMFALQYKNKFYCYRNTLTGGPIWRKIDDCNIIMASRPSIINKRRDRLNVIYNGKIKTVRLKDRHLRSIMFSKLKGY